jgi:hypothetical protein
MQLQEALVRKYRDVKETVAAAATSGNSNGLLGKVLPVVVAAEGAAIIHQQGQIARANDTANEALETANQTAAEQVETREVADEALARSIENERRLKELQEQMGGGNNQAATHPRSADVSPVVIPTTSQPEEIGNNRGSIINSVRTAIGLNPVLTGNEPLYKSNPDVVSLAEMSKNGYIKTDSWSIARNTLQGVFSTILDKNMNATESERTLALLGQEFDKVCGSSEVNLPDACTSEYQILTAIASSPVGSPIGLVLAEACNQAFCNGPKFKNDPARGLNNDVVWGIGLKTCEAIASNPNSSEEIRIASELGKNLINCKTTDLEGKYISWNVIDLLMSKTGDSIGMKYARLGDALGKTASQGDKPDGKNKIGYALQVELNKKIFETLENHPKSTPKEKAVVGLFKEFIKYKVDDEDAGHICWGIQDLLLAPLPDSNSTLIAKACQKVTSRRMSSSTMRAIHKFCFDKIKNDPSATSQQRAIATMGYNIVSGNVSNKEACEGSNDYINQLAV